MPEDLTRQLFNRLRYIEGQAQGVRRMLIGGRASEDVLTQLRALESAAAGARELYVRQLVQQGMWEEVRRHLADLLEARGEGPALIARLEADLFTPPEKRKRRRRAVSAESGEVDGE
ncbi:MAG: metal-sensitive transcriptional regulator [Chloroflexi bacterium]|nr:metal-sensitive transcriptional regulator [Chloroflexota bacterium]MCL5107297.1 metal-sensitive transcriptional regulator [Chloroflexota bacterium]